MTACIVWEGAPATAANSTAKFDKELRNKSSSLDSIRNALENRRKKLRELNKAEGSYLARIEQLEKTISASREYLAMLSSRIADAEERISLLTDSLGTAQTRLIDRQAVMRRRLRIAYMSGPPPPKILLLFSMNPLDAVHRVTYLEEVHRYDRDLIDRIEQTREEIGTRKSAYEREREKLARLLTEKQRENTKLVKEEASRKKLVAAIRTKKSANLAMIRELESARKELNKIIRLLEEKRKKAALASRGSGTFGRSKGALPWPITGSLAARFGKIVHPVYKTVTMNNGIAIRGSAGAPVFCVAEGTVLHTGAMRGLGKFVIVDHGDGFLTIYAQLEEISVATDQKVPLGGKIGVASSRGAAGGPGIHFEIRKGNDAVDPLQWLKKKQ